jgi:hypothetical protein
MKLMVDGRSIMVEVRRDERPKFLLSAFGGSVDTWKPNFGDYTWSDSRLLVR